MSFQFFCFFNSLLSMLYVLPLKSENLIAKGSAFVCEKKQMGSGSAPCLSNHSEERQACLIKRTACQALTLHPEDLIDCDHPATCQLQSVSELLKGCKDLGDEKYLALQKNLGAIQAQIQLSFADCKKLKKTTMECVQKYFPKLNIPDDLRFVDVMSENFEKWIWEQKNLKDKTVAGLKNHLQQMKSEIKTAIQNECPKSQTENRDYANCRFQAFMNALLKHLEDPYSDSSLKKLTDSITDTYVTRVVEHFQKKGCFNDKGAGRELCEWLSQTGLDTALIGLEISEFLPQRKLFWMAKPNPQIWKKSAVLEEELHQDYAAIMKNKYSPQWEKDFNEGNIGKKITVAPELQKQWAELNNLKSEGQQYLKKKKPIPDQLIQKVAQKYSEMYERAGFKTKSITYDGVVELHIDGAVSKEQSRFLSSLKEKLDLDSLFIQIDDSFFSKSLDQGAAFSPMTSHIELSPAGFQNPDTLLKSHFLFHEIRHAYIEKAKRSGKDLPYYGEVSLDDPHNELITLPGYKDYFSVDEVDTYKKQLALTKSDKNNSITSNSDLSMSDMKYKNQTESVLAYRESARSFIRVLDNVEKNFAADFEKNAKGGVSVSSSEIHFEIAKPGALYPSTAVIPLKDEQGHPMGDFTVSLVHLKEGDHKNPMVVLQDYLNQMKQKAYENFDHSQSEVQKLKTSK